MSRLIDLATARALAERLRGLCGLEYLERPSQAIVLLDNELAAVEQDRVNTLEAYRKTLADLAESEVRVARLEAALNSSAHDSPFCQRNMLGRGPCTCDGVKR